jgi:UDP-N-acetylmuramate--alanine ligase
MIGIGGTGLSAIALYLIQRGYKVSGSDRQYSNLAQRVETAGGKVFIGHKGNQVIGADLVIRSSAIPEDNDELSVAQSEGIPVYKRSEFLGMMMEGYQGIAVAGTHGKTTTTAMIAWELVALGMDPSYIIGGVSDNLGTNAHAGTGRQFVIEADEYDRMFLGLNPDIAVVTTIEYDHPDCFPTPDDFYQAFVDFVRRLTPEGILLICADDKETQRLKNLAKKQGNTAITYGLETVSEQIKPDYFGDNLELHENGAYVFDVIHDEINLARVRLQIPGRHNVSNALAAFTVGHILGKSIKKVSAAIEGFTGVDRRFEVRGEADGVVIVDDYAHHPTEIRATLFAARECFVDRELWVVWQPHTYSRTNLYFTEFTRSFKVADHVIVTKTYAARESVESDELESELVSKMGHPDARFISELNQVTTYLATHLSPGSVVMVLSAGNAQQIGSSLLEELSQRANSTDV